MRVLYLVSVWLHILAAAVWVGGMAFFMLVLVPLMRSKTVGANAGVLIHWIGVRFRSVGWASLGVLVATGSFNLCARGVRWTDLHSGDFWHSNFGETLAVKLAVVATILVISAVHDFKVGHWRRACYANSRTPPRPSATATWRAPSAGSTWYWLSRPSRWASCWCAGCREHGGRRCAQGSDIPGSDALGEYVS